VYRFEGDVLILAFQEAVFPGVPEARPRSVPTELRPGFYVFRRRR
jgi:hypothetical protein